MRKFKKICLILSLILTSVFVFSQTTVTTSGINGTPAAYQVPLFMSTSTIGNSNIFQSTSGGNIAIGTSTFPTSYIPKVQIYSTNGASSPNLSLIDNNSHRILFLTNINATNYNNITQTGDAGIIWSDNSTFNSTSGFVIAPNANATSGIRIAANGNLGLGVSNPQAKLVVNGNSELFGSANKIYGQNDAVNYYIGHYAVTGSDGLDIHWFGGIRLFDGTNSGLQITNGAVGINTINPGTTYKLAVEGKVGAREFVATNVSPWPDYVFAGNYKLMPVTELESYIKTNLHLPGIPDAGQVKKEGVSLGEMNAALLEKIEETILYVIEQQKQMAEQQKQMTEQQKQMEAMKAEINELKNNIK